MPYGEACGLSLVVCDTSEIKATCIVDITQKNHRIPRHCSGGQLGAHLFMPIYGPKKHTQTHAKHDGVGLALASPTHPEQTHITD